MSTWRRTDIDATSSLTWRQHDVTSLLGSWNRQQISKKHRTDIDSTSRRWSDVNIEIKPGFSCINVCYVPRKMLKTSACGLGFQHLPRDVANVNVLENNVWSLLLHWFNELYVKIWEKYGAIFFQRLTVYERVHFFYYPPAWSKSIKMVKMTSMFRKCCTTVVVKNEIQIHQQNWRQAYLSMQ